MFIVCNIVVIVLAGFIAYWWANQGLFSALLHLLCVVVAGAITLAFWEPLVGLVMRGSFFDDYAWGVGFIILFGLSLFILRLAMDKIAPANVDMPHWANLTFGGAAGAAAGVLTMGMFIIGVGFIQSNNSLLGFRGWGRSDRTAQVTEINRLWVPFDQLTSDFYSWLSVTSFKTGRPLRHYAPELHKQATLVRDSYRGGQGKLSLRPAEASIRDLYELPDTAETLYFLDVHFDNGARDYGEQLTLSAAQIRLIGEARGRTKAQVIYPVAWKRESRVYRFDNVSHYLTSRPGQESVDIVLGFRAPPGFSPRFLQIRNTRYDLRPMAAKPAPGVWATLFGGAGAASAGPIVEGQPIDSVIAINNDIRPVSISANMLPPSIKEVDKFLTRGEATFQGGARPSRGLRIQGIFEPPGTRCVKLDVSRGGPADIFRVMDQVAASATLALVDSRGTEYSPIGYIYSNPDGTTIRLEPTRRLRSIDQLPVLPTSGGQRLVLIFYITEEVTITGFRFGDFSLGTCNLYVPVAN